MGQLQLTGLRVGRTAPKGPGCPGCNSYVLGVSPPWVLGTLRRGTGRLLLPRPLCPGATLPEANLPALTQAFGSLYLPGACCWWDFLNIPAMVFQQIFGLSGCFRAPLPPPPPSCLLLAYMSCFFFSVKGTSSCKPHFWEDKSFVFSVKIGTFQ